jgi:pantoate--beta-alanine ligase
VQPDVAVFGEKDFQQLMVIRQLVRQFDFPIEILAAPTVRELNGLARSSRNQYLTPDERDQAALIYRQLLHMRAQFSGPSDLAGVTLIEQRASEQLRAAGFQPDYAVLRDADTLGAPQPESRALVALIAARLGKARLIDNLAWTLTDTP